MSSGPDVRATVDAAAFAKQLGLAPEVAARLEAYAEALRSWQRRINLVGSSTIGDLWQRHMLDSAQLVPLLPVSAQRLVDLGSGAGFPGLVLAILGVPEVHLVESDARKAAFLAHVSRETRTPIRLHVQRIETVPPFAADVVTARALAPLPRLIPWARRFSGPDTVWLFPKGQDVDRELTEATKTTRLQIDRIPSQSDPRGRVLRIREITPWPTPP